MTKPQYQFLKEIDNSEVPFVPKITEKANALTPLAEEILQCQADPIRFFQNKLLDYKLPHPYQYEIESLAPQPWQLSVENDQSQAPIPLNDDNFEWIATSEALDNLIKLCESQKEIAVDLEHNHTRSFQGITCLIQLSTREKDFIIDPFPIWNDIPKLNKIFSNPKIVKVLHGADMDVVWLQRDFGIYIVNLFDTGQSSRSLRFESFSLAYLLHKFCSVTADKTLQLADWTMRPLTSGFLII